MRANDATKATAKATMLKTFRFIVVMQKQVQMKVMSSVTLMMSPLMQKSKPNQSMMMRGAKQRKLVQIQRRVVQMVIYLSEGYLIKSQYVNACFFQLSISSLQSACSSQICSSLRRQLLSNPSSLLLISAMNLKLLRTSSISQSLIKNCGVYFRKKKVKIRQMSKGKKQNSTNIILQDLKMQKIPTMLHPPTQLHPCIMISTFCRRLFSSISDRTQKHTERQLCTPKPAMKRPISAMKRVGASKMMAQPATERNSQRRMVILLPILSARTLVIRYPTMAPTQITPMAA